MEEFIYVVVDDFSECRLFKSLHSAKVFVFKQLNRSSYLIYKCKLFGIYENDEKNFFYIKN